MLAVSPVASRSQAATGPSTLCGASIGGSRVGSMPNASHASADQRRSRTSSSIVDDAFDGSIASTPDAWYAT